MTSRWEGLRSVQGIQLFPPVPEVDFARLPLKLPESHLGLLRFTDGLSGAGGDIRVFGLGKHVRDQVAWNAPNEWRFAHPNRGQGFWFVADDPWGGQFAYELGQDGQLAGERVVYLSPDMTPGWTLPDFETLIDRGVVRKGNNPVDPEMAKVYARTGRIPPDKMVMPIPPVCFDGPPDWEREMAVMDARTAMIIQGDMTTELKKVKHPKRMETFTDARGLTRIRLVG